MVEFVSYDGEYPNLCRGVLIIKIDSVIHKLDNCLLSGGNIWFDDDWRDHTEYGEWSVNVPDELNKYRNQITDVVNENVPQGCCGGCI